MNKHFYTLVSSILLTAGATYAQEPTPTDIMRYNQSDLNGTARFRGMSGAFGAVGGDLSATSINPAGGAFFNHNSAAFSLSYLGRNNKSTYYDNKEKENYNGLDLGQMGAVFVFNNYNENATMKKFTIGLNYESTKNLRNNMFFRGNSNDNSLGDYFLNMANNARVPHNIANPKNINDYDQAYADAGYYGGYVGQQAFFAHQTDIIKAGQQDGTYLANYNQNSLYDQSREISSSGFSSKFSGNFSAQLGNRFYVGGNLNIHVIDYTTDSRATENILTPGGKGSLSQINYFNSTYTYGTGFSFNLGVIGKITDDLRAGISYQSPTWYSLKDELTQGMSNAIQGDRNVTFFPRVINESGSYRVQTPSHFTGSLAYVINKKGLISVDYTYKDYSNNKFKPTSDDTYFGLNEGINAMMKGTSEVRIGGEYLINQVSLRAGYRFEQSPYKDEFKMYGDLNSFSAGIGYTFGSSRLDLSYSRSSQSYKTFLVDTVGPSDYQAADIKSTNNFVSLTYNISF